MSEEKDKCPRCGSEDVTIGIGNVSGRKHLHCNACANDWREKNPAAQALGRLGGHARAEKVSKDELSAQGTAAATKRWRDERLKKNKKL